MAEGITGEVGIRFGKEVAMNNQDDVEVRMLGSVAEVRYGEEAITLGASGSMRGHVSFMLHGPDEDLVCNFVKFSDFVAAVKSAPVAKSVSLEDFLSALSGEGVNGE